MGWILDLSPGPSFRIAYGVSHEGLPYIAQVASACDHDGDSNRKEGFRRANIALCRKITTTVEV